MNKLTEALFLLLCLSFTTAEAAEDWVEMLAWVDKYPSDSLAANGPSFLDQPAIQNGLKKILPQAELAALTRYDVEAPIHKTGDYLVINKCMPHNCPADMAMLVIDVKNEKLWAGFFTREEERVSTRWYGMTDDYAVLPEDIKKEFRSRHGD